MNAHPSLLLAAVELPDKFKQNMGYGMLAVIGCSSVYCFIKCIQGADMLDQGGDGKKKIYSGIAIGVAPWLAWAAFSAAGIAEKIGLKQSLDSLPKFDSQISDVLTLAIWAVVGIASVWCVIKCISGAQMLEHGEQGKGKIVSGLAIGAAPWLAMAAFKLTGFSDAVGISLT